MNPDNGGKSDKSSYAQTSPFVRLLKTEGRVKIIDVFLGKHYKELTTQQIADLADIDRSTVTRNLSVLEETGLIKQSGKTGNAPQYRLNRENEVAKALGKAQAELFSHSEEISHHTSPDDLPFDPEEIELKDQEAEPRVLRKKAPQVTEEKDA